MNQEMFELVRSVSTIVGDSFLLKQQTVNSTDSNKKFLQPSHNKRCHTTTTPFHAIVSSIHCMMYICLFVVVVVYMSLSMLVPMLFCDRPSTRDHAMF